MEGARQRGLDTGADSFIFLVVTRALTKMFQRGELAMSNEDGRFIAGIVRQIAKAKGWIE
jgi:hypothetical protein